MIEEIYLEADKIARTGKQQVGEKRNHYVTLEQLMEILKRFED